MANTLGLPSVQVLFEKAAEKTGGASRGVLAMAIKDAAAKTPQLLRFSGAEEALAALSWNATTKAAITNAFAGGIRTLILAAVPASGELSAALALLETTRFDFCTVGGMVSGDSAAFVSWAKTMADEKGARSIFVTAAESAPDHPRVVWFDTSDVKMGGAAVQTPAYTLLPLIAGTLAALPLTQSATFLPLPMLEDCVKMTRTQADAAIAEGKFILYHDGEKVKIARGVTSLKTITSAYGAPFRKIKTVRVINAIEEDVRRLSEDNYIGKVPNTYVNKQLLVSAVLGYLRELEAQSVIEDGSTIEIDLAAQKQYLKTILPADMVAEMDDDELREALTDDKVFLRGSMRLIDAIEDITLRVAL